MTKEEKIEELISQPLVRNFYEQAQKNTTDKFRQEFERRKLGDEKLKEFDEQSEKVFKALDFENYKPLLTKCYDEQYTEEEIDFLHELYQNPLWDTMQKKLPAVTQYVMNESNKLTQELIEKAQTGENENA